MTVEAFISALNDAGITLTEQQIEQFQRYFELLVEANKQFNLTAITDEKDDY